MQFVQKFRFFVLGQARFSSAWRRWEHGTENSSLQEVLGQIDALGEVAADPDSEDDFDGEWCDEDGGWIYMVVM